MTERRKILIVSGSTRKKSVNSIIIQVISNMYVNDLSFHLFNGLTELPHFNVDLDTETPPQPVIDLRNQLKVVDGILICTPEYAMGLPGSLKNLLDWTVSSCDFSQKPVAVITASTSGDKAHASLLGTLRIIEAKVNDAATLLISHAKSQVNDTPAITDQKTLSDVKKVMEAFITML